MSPCVQNPFVWLGQTQILMVYLGLRLSHTRVSVITIKVSLPVTSQTRFQCCETDVTVVKT